MLETKLATSRVDLSREQSQYQRPLPMVGEPDCASRKSIARLPLDTSMAVKKSVIKQKEKVTQKDQKNHHITNNEGDRDASQNSEDLTASTKDHEQVTRNIIFLLKAIDYQQYQEAKKHGNPVLKGYRKPSD